MGKRTYTWKRRLKKCYELRNQMALVERKYRFARLTNHGRTGPRLIARHTELEHEYNATRFCWMARATPIDNGEKSYNA